MCERPRQTLERRAYWIPAFAGMTPRLGRRSSKPPHPEVRRAVRTEPRRTLRDTPGVVQGSPFGSHLTMRTFGCGATAHPVHGVIPAKAGIQCIGCATVTASRSLRWTRNAAPGQRPARWIPAFAGMTCWVGGRLQSNLILRCGAAGVRLPAQGSLHPRRHPRESGDLRFLASAAPAQNRDSRFRGNDPEGAERLVPRTFERTLR